MQTRNQSLSRLVLLSLLFWGNMLCAQFTIPEKPAFQTSVYDYAKVLNETEKQQLEEKLIRYSDSTTTQIVVITIESLKGEDIGILTPKWGHAWGIGGTEKNDNGVIILLAKAERKIWISAGYGLEDRLTAGIGGEITRSYILPEFKKGNYYQGLDQGTSAIIDVFKGKYKGERKKKSKKEVPFIPIAILVLVALFLMSRNKNNKSGNNNDKNGNNGGGLDLMDIILLSSLGRSGGGFGGSSGGGFSGGGGGFGGGFGGGGFSGGGSGGSW